MLELRACQQTSEPTRRYTVSALQILKNETHAALVHSGNIHGFHAQIKKTGP